MSDKQLNLEGIPPPATMKPVPPSPADLVASGAIEKIRMRSEYFRLRFELAGNGKLRIVLRDRPRGRLTTGRLELGGADEIRSVLERLREPERFAEWLNRTAGPCPQPTDPIPGAVAGVLGADGRHFLDALLWACVPGHQPERLDVTLALARYWELELQGGTRVRLESRDQVAALAAPVRRWAQAVVDDDAPCPEDLVALAPYAE